MDAFRRMKIKGMELASIVSHMSHAIDLFHAFLLPAMALLRRFCTRKHVGKLYEGLLIVMSVHVLRFASTAILTQSRELLGGWKCQSAVSSGGDHAPKR